MELNAEQIKKALELCTTTDDCVGCPYLIRRGNGAILPCTIDADALALIKQLTEENERLKQTITQLGKNNDEIARVYPLAIKEAKANTVREMQERIKTRCIKSGIYPAIVARAIDQVAKEMLEEINGTNT